MDPSKDSSAENTERIGCHSPLCYWIIAGVSISLLSSCFITKCVVSYRLFSRGCEEDKNQFDLKEHFKDFSCSADGFTNTCCPVNWKKFQSSCYFFSDDFMTWTASLKNCETMGSHLVVINTREEQNFLFQAKPSGREFYIGLTDQVVDGQWQWVDGTPFNKNLSFWDKGEPNNIAGVEDCVTIRDSSSANHNWNDMTCFFRMYRICEMPVRSFLTEKKVVERMYVL
ncbi:C-type lectin domain family 4 member E [Trichosurus vulpecula]|uniref:C-type lectin domain family 4 member E n=1 Tax=Trichosurus vulpecula TaxID=9337 RepID=UPI00186AEF70|nr:C-type lectin domain family 4 member E [Trichosurus vulpecula]